MNRYSLQKSLVVLSLLAPLSAWGADPIIHNNYGVDLLNKGDVEKAVEQLEKAYGLYAMDPTLKNNLAVAYAMMGQKFLQQKSYAKAGEQFAKAAGLFPDEPRYALLRGIALY